MKWNYTRKSLDQRGRWTIYCWRSNWGSFSANNELADTWNWQTIGSPARLLYSHALKWDPRHGGTRYFVSKMENVSIFRLDLHLWKINYVMSIPPHLGLVARFSNGVESPILFSCSCFPKAFFLYFILGCEAFRNHVTNKFGCKFVLRRVYCFHDEIQISDNTKRWTTDWFAQWVSGLLAVFYHRLEVSPLAPKERRKGRWRKI